MNDSEDRAPSPDMPAATPVPPEPKLGGSFTRDTTTGALVNNDPAAAAQPDQE